MRALVTGAGGFVGGKIARALRARGDDVIAYQRGSYPELEQLGIRCVKGDIADQHDLVAVANDVDVIFHVAAKVGGAGDPKDFERINVRGTENIIEACVKNGVNRLVFCSSPSVIDEEGGFEALDESAPYAKRYLAEYPRTKALAEQLVLEANGRETKGLPLRTCALRPHLVFGPGDTGSLPRVIERAKKGRLRMIGDGKNRVDLTYVDNVVDAHLLAAEALSKPESPAAGKAYFITNGEPVVLWDWVNEILEEIGLPPVKKSVPEGMARFVGKALDRTWSSLGLAGEPPITEWAAKMMATSHTFRIDAARRDLCYAPAVSMDEGRRRTVPWLKEQLALGHFG